MKKAIFPDFTDKTVSVGIIGNNDYAYVVDCPRFEMQGDRVFLVGRVPKGCSKRNWSEGAMRGVAWDQVAEYLVFDSAKDYSRRISKFRK